MKHKNKFLKRYTYLITSIGLSILVDILFLYAQQSMQRTIRIITLS